MEQIHSSLFIPVLLEVEVEAPGILEETVVEL
jgi:hypothetical protein